MKLVLAGCCSLLLLAPPAAAQAPVARMNQASLSGVVRNDSSGAPLAGVEVILLWSRRGP